MAKPNKTDLGIQNIQSPSTAGKTIQMPENSRQSVSQLRLTKKMPRVTISCMQVPKAPRYLGSRDFRYGSKRAFAHFVSAISAIYAGAAITKAPPEKPEKCQKLSTHRAQHL